MQCIPMRGFVGVNDAAWLDAPRDGYQRSIFRLENEGQRSAAALAHDNNHAALAGLIFGKATINAVLAMISRADVTPQVRTSTSTTPDTVAPFASDAIASRILCAMTKAVLYWQSKSRLN